MLRPQSLPSSLAFACMLAGWCTAAWVSTSRATTPAPAAPSLVYPTCGRSIGDPSGTDTLLVQYGTNVMQPLPYDVPLASLTPGLLPSDGTSGLATVVEWDPVSLAPDPLEVALRTRAYTASDLQYARARWDLVPPLVQRSVEHVADPPRLSTAWIWANDWAHFPGLGHRLWYLPSGSAEFAPARFSGTPSTPVPGAYPVLSQVACLGDSLLGAMRVLQAVGHAGAVVSSAYDGVVQRLRVPALARLRWVEFVLDPTGVQYPYLPGTLALYDAQGQSAPNLSGTPLVQADFSTELRPLTAAWCTHEDFDAIVTLEPNHDYWLLVRTAGEAGLRVRALTGTEGPDFDAGVGEFWGRQSASGQWHQLPSRALAFRLVGEPLGTAGAPPPHAAPLALRVSPNPVRGETVVQWSGTTGAVSLDVLDVRGRRVGGGRLDAAGATSWRWRAVDASGSPLPAGVYFVRATDGAGRRGAQRVVVAR